MRGKHKLAVLVFLAAPTLMPFSENWTDVRDYESLDDEALFTVASHFADVYVCGIGRKSGQGTNIVVYKYDRDGTYQWRAAYHGDVTDGDDMPVGISVDDLGFVYVAGVATRPSEGKNYLVQKLSPDDGAALWTRYFDDANSGNDVAVDLCMTRAGDICVTGTCDGSSESDIVTVV